MTNVPITRVNELLIIFLKPSLDVYSRSVNYDVTDISLAISEFGHVHQNAPKSGKMTTPKGQNKQQAILLEDMAQ